MGGFTGAVPVAVGLEAPVGERLGRIRLHASLCLMPTI